VQIKIQSEFVRSYDRAIEVYISGRRVMRSRLQPRCICRDGAQKLVACQQRVQSQMRVHARTYVVVIHVEASHAILIVRRGDIPACMVPCMVPSAMHACVMQCTSITGEQARNCIWCISQLRDSARAMRHAYSTCETVESELEEAHVQRCMWQHQL
jgi:hypothetical protein